jgi:hypothetical protein
MNEESGFGAIYVETSFFYFLTLNYRFGFHEPVLILELDI